MAGYVHSSVSSLQELLAELIKQKEIIVCCLQIFQLYSAESFDDDDGDDDDEYHFPLFHPP